MISFKKQNANQNIADHLHQGSYACYRKRPVPVSSALLPKHPELWTDWLTHKWAWCFETWSKHFTHNLQWTIRTGASLNSKTLSWSSWGCLPVVGNSCYLKASWEEQKDKGAEYPLILNRELVITTAWITFARNYKSPTIGTVSHQCPFSWWHKFVKIPLQENDCLTKRIHFHLSYFWYILPFHVSFIPACRILNFIIEFSFKLFNLYLPRTRDPCG